MEQQQRKDVDDGDDSGEQEKEKVTLAEKNKITKQKVNGMGSVLNQHPFLLILLVALASPRLCLNERIELSINHSSVRLGTDH